VFGKIDFLNGALCTGGSRSFFRCELTTISSRLSGLKSLEFLTTARLSLKDVEHIGAGALREATGLEQLTIGGDETLDHTQRRKQTTVEMTEALVTSLLQAHQVKKVRIRWATGPRGGVAVARLLEPNGSERSLAIGDGGGGGGAADVGASVESGSGGGGGGGGAANANATCTANSCDPPGCRRIPETAGLTSLVLERMELGAEGVGHIALAIKSGGGKHLKTLRIREQGAIQKGSCGDHGARLLANALSENGTVLAGGTLALESSSIKTAGAEALGAMLATSAWCTIRTLSLWVAIL
jgi:hypothetical protein